MLHLSTLGLIVRKIRLVIDLTPVLQQIDRMLILGSTEEEAETLPTSQQCLEREKHILGP